jgi:hypothetical protein
MSVFMSADSSADGSDAESPAPTNALSPAMQNAKATKAKHAKGKAAKKAGPSTLKKLDVKDGKAVADAYQRLSNMQ